MCTNSIKFRGNKKSWEKMKRRSEREVRCDMCKVLLEAEVTCDIDALLQQDIWLEQLLERKMVSVSQRD